MGTGKRLARVCIGAFYHFLIAKPRDAVAKIFGRPRQRMVVLCYHGVRPEDRSAFAWQMDTIRKAATPVALDGSGHPPSDKHLVAVTFDDGFASIRQNALPELEKRGIPATIFLPTGNLGNRPMWPMEKTEPCAGERILDAGELPPLAGPLVKFGSHSASHGNLTEMTEEEIARELRRSKEDLESILGTPVDLFAFPYGKYSPRAAELARMAGYRNAYTMEPLTVQPTDSRFLVGRCRVDPSDWKAEFWLKMRGGYEGVVPFHRLKRVSRNPARQGS
jgi:peptidoglycan/xylan/chitin deacetylase (PgdA/CDA1 family)